MAISDKLNYLIETKSKFKDRLNSLGAEIINSTTFRNYIAWVNNFYNEASDKTYLAEPGIVGRTSQESTHGKNLFNVTNYSDMGYTTNGSPSNITRTTNSISFLSNGSQNYSGIYITLANSKLYIDNYDVDTVYCISADITVDKACTFGSFQTASNYQELPVGTTRYAVYSKNINSGNTINFYVKNYITGGVNVKIENIMVTDTNNDVYEPYGVGNIPNTNSPRPINNLSGNVAYKVSGKNLFDKDNATLNQYLNSSGDIVTPTDNVWYLSDYILVSPNEQYTYQGLTFVGTAPYSAYYDENKNLVSTFKQAVGVNTITIPNNVYYIRFSIINRTANDDFNLSTFMIEKGSTAGTYELYIGPQTFTIPLGNIELCEIDTYEDKIYSNNGRFYLEKNIEKIILDGDENWSKSSTTLVDRFVESTRRADLVSLVAKSNYFINYNGYGPETFYFDPSISGTYRGRVVINFSKYNTTTLANFKSWLSTHNVIVYYILSTPVVTEITSSNYPELYSVLKEVQDYLTQYKINKEFLLDYSSPEITY